MNNVCLTIIFNHKFNKNLPTLEKIYGNRFSNLYYIVPFFNNENVGIDNSKIISVFETSYCFQGYIAQAYSKIKNNNYSHYIFIGDDQILNPYLNENNIIEIMGMSKNDSYIKEIVPYDEIGNGSLVDKSNKLYNIISAFRINTGVSYREEIPLYDDAVGKCRFHNLKVAKKLPIVFFMNRRYLSIKNLLLTLVTLGINGGRKLRYPLFKAYSDMIIIDSSSMNEFCHLSGIFAAMNVFVETAIPLAMVLACSSIKYENDLKKLHGIEYWGEDITIFEEKFDKNLNKLFDNFGDDILYYHPVKLSKWRLIET